jgi:hypothetical protein
MDEAETLPQEFMMNSDPKVCTLCSVEYPDIHIAFNYANEKYICAECWNEHEGQGERKMALLDRITKETGEYLMVERKREIKRKLKTRIERQRELRAQ